MLWLPVPSLLPKEAGAWTLLLEVKIQQLSTTVRPDTFYKFVSQGLFLSFYLGGFFLIFYILHFTSSKQKCQHVECPV